MNIVVSRFNKNVDWTNKFKKEYNIMIYDKENQKNPYNVPVNKGNEASVYLKYIIDNYENLPEFTFFIHDDEFAWHHTGSIIEKLDEAISSQKPYFNVNDRNVMVYLEYIDNNNSDKLFNELLPWYETYIEKYIPKTKIPYGWTVGYRGSAQFLVNKSVILKLPKKFYEDLYNWIITTELPSFYSGRFMEWTWHIFWEIHPNIIE